MLHLPKSNVVYQQLIAQRDYGQFWSNFRAFKIRQAAFPGIGAVFFDFDQNIFRSTLHWPVLEADVRLLRQAKKGIEQLLFSEKYSFLKVINICLCH